MISIADYEKACERCGKEYEEACEKCEKEYEEKKEVYRCLLNALKSELMYLINSKDVRKGKKVLR